MKKKTFFYKFNKNIDKYSASNHNYITEKDNEDKSVLKIKNLLANENEILEKINTAKEAFIPYYEKRNIAKSYILKNEWLEKYIKHFTQNNHYIININFWKTLSDKDISSFLELLWVDIFRVSSYDTVLEIVIEKQKDLFKELTELIKEESSKLKTFLKNEEYWDSNKFLFYIENLNIDSTNRSNLFNLNEELKCTRTLVKINQNSFSKEDLGILKEIYLLYKNTNSSVKVEEVNDEEISYLLFFFNDVNIEFFKKISELFDSIISIEVIDWYQDYIQLDSIDKITVEDINTETILNSICIVDSKVVINNPILNNIVTYWNVYDINQGDSHWTNVATLASYWRVNELKLWQPICSIYNIESLQETFNKISNIIQESLSKWIKIINISQWVVNNYLKDNDWISELGKIIDKELVNKDILLLLSSWNINPSKKRYHELLEENANINIPKDSISSISIWAKDNDWNPSLYSRKSNIVPSYKIWDIESRLYRVKEKKSPAFIEYWDNIVFNGDWWYNSKWTSFASPLLWHKAIKILNHYWNISTNTIKALFINYASQENLNAKLYWQNKDLYHRHTWWWEVDISKLLNENDKTINIVIEDYISQNQAKKYKINLPDIEEWKIIEIKNAISYNPPISNIYHLKYSKFNVSAKLWSDTYENVKNNIFWNDWLENPYKTWKEWKDERWTINRVNYFWNTQMWSSNSSRSNYYKYEWYKELQDNTEIIIEWHTRNNFKFNQKFSFVMTIDISNLVEPRKYIENFIQLNNQIIIEGIEIEKINENIKIKNQTFEAENELNITIEDLWIFNN